MTHSILQGTKDIQKLLEVGGNPEMNSIRIQELIQWYLRRDHIRRNTNTNVSN